MSPMILGIYVPPGGTFIIDGKVIYDGRKGKGKK